MLIVTNVSAKTVYLPESLAPGKSIIVSQINTRTQQAKDAGLVTTEALTTDGISDPTISDYAALRAYTGTSKALNVTQRGIAGTFVLDAADTTSTDDGGTVILAGANRWKRVYSGPLDVKWFGAKGDGTTDDTTAIQAAINVCRPGGSVLFSNGDIYRASNIKLPSGVKLVGSGGSMLKALNSGDVAYFVGTSEYVENEALQVNSECKVEALIINANGVKAVALGWRCFYGEVTKAKVFGSTNTDVLVTTLGMGGAAAPVGTMVNNKFVDNRLGGADDFGLAFPQYVFRVEDPAFNKCTDMIVTGNYISGATVRTAYFDTAAGLLFQHNHTYGGSVEFRRGFMGFSCANNFFEDDVILDDITAGITAAVFGPGNTVMGILFAKFGNNCEQIVSRGNTYFDSASIRHCYNDPSKMVISSGDVFSNADPLGFYEYDGVTPKTNSMGRFKSVGSYLANQKRDWIAEFDGAGKTYNSPSQNTFTAKAYMDNKFLIVTDAQTTGNISLSVEMPALGGDGPPAEIELAANSNQNYGGASNLTYLAKGTITKKWDGTYYIHVSNLVYNAAEWATPPAFTAVESGDTVTVTMTGVYNGNGTQYFMGGALMKITQ